MNEWPCNKHENCVIKECLCSEIYHAYTPKPGRNPYRSCFNCALTRRMSYRTCVFCGSWQSQRFDTCIRCANDAEGKPRGREARELRLDTLIVDNFTCVYCASDLRDLVVTHIQPVRLGGDHSPWNLITVCSTCSVIKGEQWPAGANKFMDKWARTAYHDIGVEARHCFKIINSASHSGVLEARMELWYTQGWDFLSEDAQRRLRGLYEHAAQVPPRRKVTASSLNEDQKRKLIDLVGGLSL